jgi:hypothetical protein
MDNEHQCPTCGGCGFVPDDDDQEEVINTQGRTHDAPDVLIAVEHVVVVVRARCRNSTSARRPSSTSRSPRSARSTRSSSRRRASARWSAARASRPRTTAARRKLAGAAMCATRLATASAKPDRPRIRRNASKAAVAVEFFVLTVVAAVSCRKIAGRSIKMEACAVRGVVRSWFAISRRPNWGARSGRHRELRIVRNDRPALEYICRPPLPSGAWGAAGEGPSSVYGSLATQQMLKCN